MVNAGYFVRRWIRGASIFGSLILWMSVSVGFWFQTVGSAYFMGNVWPPVFTCSWSKN